MKKKERSILRQVISIIKLMTYTRQPIIRYSNKVSRDHVTYVYILREMSRSFIFSVNMNGFFLFIASNHLANSIGSILLFS
jgi:hypothetical protein